MAVYPFNTEFGKAQSNINLGDRTKIAIAAHVEVRTVLNANAALREAGLADVLVGSYARLLSIWPGKDVDVFGRLVAHTVGTITPASAYELFAAALAPFDGQGRLTRQPRSLKSASVPSIRCRSGRSALRAKRRAGPWPKSGIS